MCKLIDADELREVIAGHVCTVSTCGTVAEAKAKMEFKKQVLQDIEEQPTIDAVPVTKFCEWLEKHGCHILKEAFMANVQLFRAAEVSE